MRVASMRLVVFNFAANFSTYFYVLCNRVMKKEKFAIFSKIFKFFYFHQNNHIWFLWEESITRICLIQGRDMYIETKIGREAFSRLGFFLCEELMAHIAEP